MKGHGRIFCLLIAAYFVAATATTAHAQGGQCAFETLNFPAPANRLPSPRALNDVGAIVGTYLGGNTAHGFLLYQGKVASFMFPGSTITEAWDISRTGIIVGTYNVTGVPGTLGFMVKSGVFHQIKIPGFLTTNVSVFGVNDNGDVVGRFVANDTAFGFLLRNGKLTILSFPGAQSGTTPSSINDQGVVVGNFSLSPGDTGHAFMWKDGVFSNVSPPGSTTATASKISNTGVVVGSYVSSVDFLRHGYALKNGTYTTIDIAGAQTLIDAVNKFDNVIAEKEQGSIDPLFKGFCSAAF
jgi:probable HAF family extracellular repeat protein